MTLTLAALTSLWMALPPDPPARGGGTITTEAPQGPDLGKVAQDNAQTSVWRVDPDTGDVTLLSGEAFRLTNGPAAPPMITIDCGLSACRGATVMATFTPTNGARATVLGFRPGRVNSQGLSLLNVSGAGTTHLVMTFHASDAGPARATFPLGLTVRLAPGRESRSSDYGYSLLVTRLP